MRPRALAFTVTEIFMSTQSNRIATTHPAERFAFGLDRPLRDALATFRICCLVFLGAASVAASCSGSQAAGSFQTKPAFADQMTPGSTRPPISSAPNTVPGNLIGGCGRGRIRDPETHTCRGPADLR
jgi:hypothetical protein